MASTLEGRKRNSDDGLITPTTPKRTRRTTRHIEDLSPLNQPTNNIIKSRELIDCFITTISHRECCPEGGTFSYHKGIEPGYPKGHYCCQNACMSSGKELLLKYIGPYYLVCGSYGPLGCVGPEHSSAIRQKIADMGGDTAVEIEVNGFSCFTDDVSLKRIPGSYPPKFLPSTLTWR